MHLQPQTLLQIRSFIELPDATTQLFLDALKNAESKFNIYDLINDVTRRTRLARGIVAGVIEAIAAMYLAKDRKGSTLDTFLDEEVAPDLKNDLVAKSDKAASKEDIEARWAKFRKFLSVALTLDATLGTAAKTGPVMTDHDRIFVEARILSDVRFVFHPDLSEKPDVAVVVHMLRITTRDIYGAHKAEYFALDSNDIRFMKQILDRAVKKEDTIISAMEGSGIKVLAPKGIF